MDEPSGGRRPWLTRRLVVLLMILTVVIGAAFTVEAIEDRRDAAAACRHYRWATGTAASSWIQTADAEALTAATELWPWLPPPFGTGSRRWRPLSDALGELHTALVAEQDPRPASVAVARECARAGL